MKKRPNINHKTVIGFDETHNGFHLNYEYGVDFPLIITGYLYKSYPGSHHSNTQFERKGGILTFANRKTTRSLKDIQRRAIGYISSHPDFYYSRISQAQSQGRPLLNLRAEAIAVITFKLIKEYNLKENNLYICLDDLGVKEDTICLNNYLKCIFEFSDLFVGNYNSHVYFQHRADVLNRACKSADRIGYYLCGLKFRGPRERWPFRNRDLNLDSFLDLAFERIHK